MSTPPNQHGVVVDVVPDTFLPMSVRTLSGALGRALNDSTDGPAWDSFVDNIRAVVTLHYGSVLDDVRDSLLEFKKDQPPSDHHHHYSHVTSCLSTLFDAAQFMPLTQDTFTTALAVEYEFDFPVSVEWSNLDASFIQNDDPFQSSDRDWQTLKDHVLVYTRGVGQTSKTEHFFPQKLEYLLNGVHSRCVAIKTLLDSLTPFAKQRPKVVFAAVVAEAETYPLLATGPPQPPSPRTHNPSEIQGKRRVTRRSLHEALREDGFWTSFFRKVTVSEPTFERVCVVYKERRNGSTDNGLAGKVKQIGDALKLRNRVKRRGSTVLGTSSANILQQHLSERPACPGEIKVELYENIPFGDLEAVFPHKVIKLKLLDTAVFAAKFAMACVLCLLAVRNLFSSPEVGVRVRGTLLLMFLFLMSVLKNAAGIIMGWMNLRKGYERDVSNWVKRKMCAQDIPAIAQLVDDVKEQEVKEVLLAYFFLWRSGGACTAVELDTQIEAFFNTYFNANVNFDEDDAVKKLVVLGLADENIGCDGTTTYTIRTTPQHWVAAHPHENLASISVRAMPTASSSPTAAQYRSPRRRASLPLDGKKAEEVVI